MRQDAASWIAGSTSMLELRLLQQNDAWLLVFFALVLTAVFILLTVTFVEMVHSWRWGWPTVLLLLPQCTMEFCFSVNQKKQTKKGDTFLY